MATLFQFVSPVWDDIADHQDLPAVFADLLAAAQPFTITALPRQHAEQGWETRGNHLHQALEAFVDADFDDHSAECLSPADRNPSLCFR